jgi:hypothetical protein
VAQSIFRSFPTVAAGADHFTPPDDDTSHRNFTFGSCLGSQSQCLFHIVTVHNITSPGYDTLLPVDLSRRLPAVYHSPTMKKVKTLETHR